MPRTLPVGTVRKATASGRLELAAARTAARVWSESVSDKWRAYQAALFARAALVAYDRYVNEFTFRLNDGDVKRHTLDRLASLITSSFGPRLTYRELIA